MDGLGDLPPQVVGEAVVADLAGGHGVVEEPQGTRRIYRLHDQGVEAVEAFLNQVWGDVAARFRLMAENTAPEPRSRS